MSVILSAIQAGIEDGVSPEDIVRAMISQGLDNPSLMIETLTLEIIKLLNREKVQPY